MITQNELSSLNLSPTKKDFVQIWNELIEVASKITERWDPTSTNESDPGIVLLKVLAGIADKLNYNIDKNILEAYMPTAAQMESMRKLCELVGYDIKYYQSAETKVRITYTGEEDLPNVGLALPKFTTITNADKDITFVTTNSVSKTFTNATRYVEVPCIEGQISQCESVNENNLITLSQLDASNRYYLPEIQIAENGIFVYNAEADFTDGIEWKQVSNLNTRPPKSRVFKFGYDSQEGRPYLAFPDDVGSLIEDGLFIYFIRTSGFNGNISPNTLEVLEIPTGESWNNYSAEQFEVVNVDAATNGANVESISAAYNSFKKTVGTFDTLVTCRDYMNKIYSLMGANNSPYVSNILVTDIRNDINNAITLCSCNEFGILYKETPLLSSVSARPCSIRRTEPTEEANVYKLIISQGTHEEGTPLMDHFDLVLYPFRTFNQVSYNTKKLADAYNQSFTYENLNREIEDSLKDFKTCAHNIKPPAEGDIIAINNYLKLNALIATSTKVSAVEAEVILQNVKVALVNEFNLRNLDFGEEIPFDSILSVIENADPRIRVVSLQEPTVLTTYSVKVGSTSKEYGIASATDIAAKNKNVTISGVDYTNNCQTAKEIYNKLVLRNILAGRASLFDYDETFVSNNSEKPYTVTHDIIQSIDKVIAAGDKETATDAEKQAAANAKTLKARILHHHQVLANITNPGEYLLSGITGLYNGIVTLKVDKKPIGASVPTANVYETYKPFDKEIIDDIKRVEAVCEITSNVKNAEGNTVFKDIELKKNEVIKFRAPNLITTKTFPAYVYYRFERASSSSSGGQSTAGGSSAGRYAQAVSLKEFTTSVIGTERFFTDLWGRAEEANRLVTRTAEKPESGKPDTRPDLPSIFARAVAVGVDPKIDNTEIYLEPDELTTALNTHFQNSDAAITIKYYPLNQGTMNTWSKCVKGFSPNLPGDTTLWRLSSTHSHPKGRLVTEEHQRLYAQDGDTLATTDVGLSTYICTDLGADPTFYSIPKDSDVELRKGDKLYIHYTPSSTNEAGETVDAEPITTVYESSDEDAIIIKPSFDLIPSEDVKAQGTSWKKTIYFNGKELGLLSLAPNEQIEMRSISRVVLSKPARFYRNFEASQLDGNPSRIEQYELKDGEYIFYTDQNTQEAAYYGSGSVITLDPGVRIPKPTTSVEVSQILEHGLHIVPWSSDVLLSKETKITITEYQYRTLTEGDVLNTLTIPSDISENTLSSSKWTKCLSTKETPITYTTSGSENSITLPKIELSSGPTTSWEVCSFLELSTSPGYAQPLEAVAKVVGEDETADGEKSLIQISKTDKINLYRADGTLAQTIQPQKTVKSGVEVFEPISIKLDTIAQVASGDFEIKKSEDEQEDQKEFLKIKVFKEEEPSLIELKNDELITPISEKTLYAATPDNINNYWSAIDIAGKLVSETEPRAFKLNFTIPENADLFGIFSIYLEVAEDKLNADSHQNMLTGGSRVFIDLPEEFGAYKEAVTIFNYQETVNSNTCYWWSESADYEKSILNSSGRRLYLRAGLNCIKIHKSCSLLIKAESNAVGTVIYDSMRLVKGVNTHGINMDLIDFNLANTLADNSKTKETLADDLLTEIARLDRNREFYYNVPVENSLAIEFDNNISTFSNSYTLYDVNNINNDFVISKLDVNYLDEGLRIAKSSKY